MYVRTEVHAFVVIKLSGGLIAVDEALGSSLCIFSNSIIMNVLMLQATYKLEAILLWVWNAYITIMSYVCMYVLSAKLFLQDH